MRRHRDGGRARRDATSSPSVSTDQDEFHAKYGGIVPEIASRRHAALFQAAVEDALGRAASELADGSTGSRSQAGPGLIGSLVVGVASAKALAAAPGDARSTPSTILHGHIFAAFLESREEPEYPFHRAAGLRRPLRSSSWSESPHRGCASSRRTRDDAAGEAFNEAGAAGPALSRRAGARAARPFGRPAAVTFPVTAPPDSLDLSFSGLKTSASYFLASPDGAALAVATSPRPSRPPSSTSSSTASRGPSRANATPPRSFRAASPPTPRCRRPSGLGRARRRADVCPAAALLHR